MTNDKIKIRKKFWTISIIALYCLFSFFFNARPLVESNVFAKIVSFILYLSLLGLFPDAIKGISKDGVIRIVSVIILIYVLGVLWSFMFWGQSIASGIQALQAMLPLLFFYVQIKQRYSRNSIIEALVILSIIYVLCYFQTMITYPNNYFGYIPNLDENMIEKMSESRGVLRLIGVPGNDIIVFLFFWVIVKGRRNKKWLLFCIPLVYMIVMRGTRMPFYMALSLAFFYYLSQIKNIFKFGIIGILLLISVFFVHNTLLNMDSNNVIVRYAQMTSGQIEDNNKEEDIRIRNIKYFLFEFNENPLTVILGNGVPKTGDYHQKITSLKKKGYYLSDVGFSMIFIYWGILGVIAYIWLFITIVKTKVRPEYMFGKLFVIYMFMILPTNVAMICRDPLLFSISLYLVYLGGHKVISKKIKLT